LRNFFSQKKSACGTPILRRAGAAEIPVKGLHARLPTNFRAAKKCPFRRHFCNCVKIARAARTARAARVAHADRATRCIAPTARETAVRTRFINAEAVFFILLV